jgi:hypothetical protein
MRWGHMTQYAEEWNHSVVKTLPVQLRSIMFRCAVNK